MTDQTQDDAEARFGKQSSILLVGNLPDLAQDDGRYARALKECDGILAGYDTNLFPIGLCKECAVYPLLLGGEIENGVGLIARCR